MCEYFCTSIYSGNMQILILIIITGATIKRNIYIIKDIDSALHIGHCEYRYICIYI